jgi:hypothetical protein
VILAEQENPTMLTDVFHKRYPDFFRFGDGVPQAVHVFLRQGAQIVFQDLSVQIPDIEVLCQASYEKLVRELGYGIHRGASAEEICTGALYEAYDLWNDSHRSPEEFVQVRFSLLELLFSEIENETAQDKKAVRRSGLSLFGKKEKQDNPQANSGREIFVGAVRELNLRLREARIPLHYNNGLFQLSSDDLSESKIREPFWNILKEPKWVNVEIDIKEAIDRRDHRGRDAAFYALKALESAIKIISDEKGWSRGTERGAANYLDNLLSSANGRFIDVWESDQLKALFRDLRNPHGHGPGSGPQPALSDPQEAWVIECAMIWIKSLVGRI